MTPVDGLTSGTKRSPAAGRLEGSFVALVTPFNASGDVDFGALAALVKWQEENGTAAVLVGGTTGEYSVLSDGERRQLIERSSAFQTRGMRIFQGCTGRSTEETINYVLLAQCSGADGALISVPPYTSPPPADAERYFLEVADATDLPLGTYNNAPRLRTDMDTKSLARILARADYVLHKESTGRVHQVAELLSLAPDVSFMSDDSPEPGLAVQTMALGGSGLCNGAGNLAPRELVTLSTPWREATQSEIFRNEYLRLLPLLQVIYATTSPVAIKTLMAALGMPAGQLRKPLRTPGADFLQSALEVLDSLGLREKYACDF